MSIYSSYKVGLDVFIFLVQINPKYKVAQYDDGRDLRNVNVKLFKTDLVLFEN